MVKPTVLAKTSFDVLTADTASLQSLLRRGIVNNVAIFEVYLAQISQHDEYLHAMIQITPLPSLKASARALDQER